MRLFPALLLFPFLVLLFGCPKSPDAKDGEQLIKPFYYPVMDLVEGRVYEYRWNRADAPPTYAYMVVVPDSSGAQFLVTTEYNDDLEPVRIFREQVLNDGILLVDCRWILADAEGGTQQQSIEVLEGANFPWYAKPDTVMAFRRKLRYSTFDEGKKMTVTEVKDRFFQGPSRETFSFSGKNYPCVTFLAKTKLMYQREDGLQRSGDFTATEYYAEGLGLVRLLKKLPDGSSDNLLLRKVYTMPEFEALHAQKYPQDTTIRNGQ